MLRISFSAVGESTIRKDLRSTIRPLASDESVEYSISCSSEFRDEKDRFLLFYIKCKAVLLYFCIWDKVISFDFSREGLGSVKH